MQARPWYQDPALFLERLPLICLAVIALAGLLWPDPTPLSEGFANIVRSPDILIHDYIAVGGIRATMLNASLVGAVGYCLLLWTKTPITGGALAAIFIMTGFAFFGKNIVNIFPIIIGVYLYSLVRRESFQSYVLVALFGTGLAPIGSQFAYDFGYGLPIGILVGIASGFIIPCLAVHLLVNQQGFLLYNVGFTAGFIGTLITSQIRAYGKTSDPTLVWSHEYHLPLTIFFALYFVGFILLGLLLDRKSWRHLPPLMQYPGNLTTDFPALVGVAPTLINMGLVGLIGLSYILLVGGVITGPTIGGLLTMLGFAAFGKHPRNILPPMLGVYIGTLLKVYNAADPGPLLAALFVTGIAPVSGYYGPLVGLVAGYLHLGMVMHVGWLQGGLNLYNNGFSGGLVTIFVVAIAKGLSGRQTAGRLKHAKERIKRRFVYR
ncbi:MAG: DUF1576 domain-containing protein, partial [Firmicutes bacterium]|nr:DUF1576 domain-containing protein [Bacillota bacterium]